MISADIPPVLHRPSLLRPVPFDAIPRAAWERLHAQTAAATPFSSWTFQRAWWDAYGASARERYLVLMDASATPAAATNLERVGRLAAGMTIPEALAPLTDVSALTDISAIVPLMWRPGPSGLERDGDAGRGTLYFGASYHADYATVLADPEHLPHAAGLLAEHLVAMVVSGQVGRVDLRRIAESDPLLDLLPIALDRGARGTRVVMRLEQEDVCPTIELEGDWSTQLGRLDKKSRHEVRRKLRRAEREGPVTLRYLPLGEAAAERFIRFHQARWGAAGLFAEGEDGDRGRVFLRRLTELEGHSGAAATFHIAEVSVAGEPIYLLAGFASRATCFFYNAGLDPAYLDLSPGIVGTAAYLRDRIERGDRRFDFLRGDEPYKYQWAARDGRLMRLRLTLAPEQSGDSMPEAGLPDRER